MAIAMAVADSNRSPLRPESPVKPRTNTRRHQTIPSAEITGLSRNTSSTKPPGPLPGTQPATTSKLPRQNAPRAPFHQKYTSVAIVGRKPANENAAMWRIRAPTGLDARARRRCQVRDHEHADAEDAEHGLLGQHHARAEQEAAPAEERSLAARGAHQQQQAAQQARGGGAVGADLQALLQEHDNEAEERRAEPRDLAAAPQAAEAERQPQYGAGEHPHPQAGERQESGGRGRIALGVEERQVRRQEEVQPGRVMLEEVPVHDEALRDVPGVVDVLELVRVEFSHPQ